MEIGTWVLIGFLAAIVLIAEIAQSKQRAETDEKIDEMHKWLKRCHPYKFNGYDDRDKIEYRNGKRMQDNLPNEIDLDIINKQNAIARNAVKAIKENKD